MRASVAVTLVVLALQPCPSYTQASGTDIYLVQVRDRDGELTFGKPRNITDRAGYDNQPSFLPDGRSLLYTSNREGQTDIFRYYIRTNATRQVTRTAPESEYSPAVTLTGDVLSVVRVEADSTQRLWQFFLDGSAARVVLTQIKPVGYYAWGDDYTLGLFVLGDSVNPSTFQLADTRTGRAHIVAYRVGRSIHKVPGRRAISFTHRVPEYWVKEIDLETQAVRPLIQLPAGNEHYTWTPDGTILFGEGSTLSAWNPTKDDTWREIADFTERGIRNISRLAMSPLGDWLAIVGEREQ